MKRQAEYYFPIETAYDRAFCRAVRVQSPNPERVANREPRTANRQLNYSFACTLLVGFAILALAIYGACHLLEAL